RVTAVLECPRITRSFSREPPLETNRPPYVCRVLRYQVSRGSLACAKASVSAASIDSLHTRSPWWPVHGKHGAEGVSSGGGRASFHCRSTSERAGDRGTGRDSPSLTGPASLRR